LPPLFQWLQREGNVADNEMHRVFNCGIGMVAVVAAEHERVAVELLGAAGEQAFRIGRIESRKAGMAQTVVI
jgi:phosphoribosylformylglycinamidine cyclo-ligase